MASYFSLFRVTDSDRKTTVRAFPDFGTGSILDARRRGSNARMGPGAADGRRPAHPIRRRAVRAEVRALCVSFSWRLARRHCSSPRKIVSRVAPRRRRNATTRHRSFPRARRPLACESALMLDQPDHPVPAPELAPVHGRRFRSAHCATQRSRRLRARTPPGYAVRTPARPGVRHGCKACRPVRRCPCHQSTAPDLR